MEISRVINIAIGCVMASELEINEKREVIDSLRDLEVESFDKRLISMIDNWKKQTGRQIECQNEGSDHDLCPKCNEQLYFCDCADRMAQRILELQFGFNDFEE